MSIVEIIAVIVGLVSVILTTKQNIWCWPIGLISIIAFLILFFTSKLYSGAILHVIFLAQSSYGWYAWNKGKDGSKLPVKKMNWNFVIFEVLLAIIGGLIFGIILEVNTDAQSPYLDATIATLSLLANWYLVRKVIQAWWIWVIVDVLGIIMFTYQGLYLTSILYVIFLGLSFRGLYSWGKDLKTV